jgi:hypothetical protein
MTKLLVSKKQLEFYASMHAIFGYRLKFDPMDLIFIFVYVVAPSSIPFYDGLSIGIFGDIPMQIGTILYTSLEVVTIWVAQTLCIITIYLT